MRNESPWRRFLLTPGDTEQRRRYLNARSTLNTLWRSAPCGDQLRNTRGDVRIRYGEQRLVWNEWAQKGGCGLPACFSERATVCSRPSQ